MELEDQVRKHLDQMEDWMKESKLQKRNEALLMEITRDSQLMDWCQQLSQREDYYDTSYQALKKEYFMHPLIHSLGDIENTIFYCKLQIRKRLQQFLNEVR